jgi:hypothetical protein
MAVLDLETERFFYIANMSTPSFLLCLLIYLGAGLAQAV